LIAARINGCFTGPLLFEGVANAATFNAWVKQMLCPLLYQRHLVILDNASLDKGHQTAALISATGASLLFLPPYSPALNPIETDFATIKRYREYNSELSLDEIIEAYQ
jgi:transposase